MYRITVLSEGEEYSLHEPYDEEIRVISPVLTLDMSTVGNLAFQVAATHPHADKLLPLSAEIYVYDDEKVIFCGRMPKPIKNFYNTLSVSCEGELAYLLDSQQRPYEFSGNIPDFIAFLLERHNSQVEERKKFYPGQIAVTDDNNYINRSNSDFSNTLEALKGKLVENHGGYFRVRRQDGKRYLDYVHDFGGINSQAIRFGENMLDMSRYQDATQIITCLIPRGADVETTNQDGSLGSKTIDITSVNGGSDSIEHVDGIKQYGKIWGTYKWDDVTEPEKLLEKAKVYLDEAVALPMTLEISAVDLGLIDVDVERLKLGYWTTVESIPHGLEKQFLLSKKVMNLENPGKDRITLGRTIQTFTGGINKEQIKASDKIDQVASSTSKEINRKVENATQLITGGLGGYVVIGRAEDGHPEEILVMDAPDKQAAKNVIRLNQNGLGFSTTGYNGVYRNAWTIDGNLVADFITTGSMLADRIRGGSLELGGTGLGRDGRIVVKDASDKQIGYWDKTGLHVYQGVIEGTDIRGGTIDIGSGTFTVERDGSVCIESGEINIGPVFIDDNIVDLGGYRVSSDRYSVFYSKDLNIEMWSKNPEYNGSPTLILGKGGQKTLINNNGIDTNYVYCTDIYLSGSWWKGWSLEEEIRLLHDAVFKN